jgi:MFS family permease
MGLGVSNFYTMVLSLALDASDGNDKLAGSRATLASGLAILILPLLLGYLADQLGIRLAFGLVGVLIVLLSTILRLAANIAAIKSLSYYKR